MSLREGCDSPEQAAAHKLKTLGKTQNANNTLNLLVRGISSCSLKLPE